jgi:excisionase family DNA binding protein
MTIADKIEKTEHLLTIDQLAALLQFSPKTLYAKAKAGTIPVTRLSGSLRFDPKLIAVWIRDRTV